MSKILSLLILSLIVTCVSSQTLTNIPLPESCSVSHYSENDTIAVLTTGWNNMYYRFKHDTVWTQITTPPFDFYSNISVYNTNIYVMAITDNDTSMSGLLVSHDMGQTWTQKLTQDFLTSHNVAYPSLFASDDNSFAGWYGSVLKECNYFTNVITDISPFLASIPPHKLQYWNGVLFYYGYNHTSGSVIGGEVAYQITSTVWGFHGAPPNGLQMVATERGNEMLFVDRGSGLFYTSNNAVNYNQWQFNSGSDFNSSFQVICGYGNYYVIRDKNIYHSSNGTSWNYFYNTAVPNGTVLEVLPNGNLLMNFGPMLEYDPLTNKFKSFNHGINEAGIESASINSSNDVFIIADNMKYYKSHVQNDWKMLFHVNDYVNPHVSNSGVLYLNGYGTLIVSNDSGNTFNSMGWLDYYPMHFKNDSVLMLSSYSTQMSINGGQTLNPAATPAYADSVIYIGAEASNFNRNQLMIRALYLSSYSQLFYTTDFGNSWITSDTVDFNSNTYGTGFAIDNDLYYINVNNFAADTIYKILPSSNQVMTTFVNNPTDSIIEKNFWVDDSHLYLQQIVQHSTQYYFQVYRSLSLTGVFTQLFSIQVNGVAGFTTGKFANCHDKKLFWMAQNKLFLFEDNTALSVSEYGSQNELLLYPNPASDKINFTSNTLINSLRLFNVLGKEVYCSELNSSQYRLDISNLPGGIYFYKITGVNGFVKSGKIIKNSP